MEQWICDWLREDEEKWAERVIAQMEAEERAAEEKIKEIENESHG